MFATGWDRASAILKVFAQGNWSTYRLPKASHTFDHWWQTEWTRIREVETERYLMDCHGMFYELSPVAHNGRVWGVRPISTHLWVVPDFCSWNGFLVLAGNQVTPIGDATISSPGNRKAACGRERLMTSGSSASPGDGEAHGGTIPSLLARPPTPT